MGDSPSVVTPIRRFIKMAQVYAEPWLSSMSRSRRWHGSRRLHEVGPGQRAVDLAAPASDLEVVVRHSVGEWEPSGGFLPLGGGAPGAGPNLVGGLHGRIFCPFTPPTSPPANLSRPPRAPTGGQT